ncbi:MAG: aminomethyl-transferring glycine dehydrogenase subunit GcvPA [Anaerolineae bacterium]|jgi:glycine dehydrogenase subunit 1|nr:aminomethyl-transferring glycine dehydrogenase subunit GcvPA [Anaerolineae bacterium]MBT7075321.1 aminomethyl-transferring glycine dehydrogenase subunit GcvPA [Anaerolineae bacterium]MBT7783920.1 aminomethyl-transferring glycine dehydrogenase subunit GcvPA [Anaerolineae bacterium]
MTYIPHSPKERDEMLAAIGVEKMEDLFTAVPEKHRYPELNLPPALTEMEAAAELSEIAQANETVKDLVSFLGAGVYNHYIPSAINHILLRGEFYTAYTPYQPEISQGTLQAIFEYQALVANLTGMDVANASHYDGATAVAEAVNMALAQFRGKRKKVIMSASVHPQYRATTDTYTQFADVEFVSAEASPLQARPEDLIPLIDKDTALVVVQYPDFFGRIFDYTKLADAAHEAKALFCVVANPTALGMLKTPGEMGADMVVGEGQPLGIAMSYGGPYLGFFTTRNKFVRKMAGRLVGESVDARGQRAFVLTLTPREQHIKRERATSNICSNQGLLALAAGVYMSLLGQTGMKHVAELCYHKAHYAAEEIAKIPSYELSFDASFFHEFVVTCPKPVAEINAHLLEHGILGGYDLGEEYAGMENQMLVAVTEMNSKEEIDALVAILSEVNHD